MKTILSAVILLLLSLSSCTFSSSTSTSTKTSTTTRTFNGGELTYNETITDEEATALGNYLVEGGFFDGKSKTVKLSKENGIIHFAFTVATDFANSAEYEQKCVTFISELEKEVFKGGKVEIDFCDDNFNVKKNIKGDKQALAATDVTPVSMQDAGTADASLLPNKHWYCENITGGEPKDAAQADRELEIIRNNFSFDFVEDGTFGSRFINQADLENPTEVLGSYTIEGNTITFHDLTIGGQPTNQQMQFGFSATDDRFQLTSKADGQPDLVMTFAVDK